MGPKGKELAQDLKELSHKTEEYTDAKDRHLQDNIKDKVDAVKVEIIKEKKEQVPLEWGNELPNVRFSDIESRLQVLNKNVRKGEQWRLPTAEEFCEKFRSEEGPSSPRFDGFIYRSIRVYYWVDGGKAMSPGSYSPLQAVTSYGSETENNVYFVKNNL